MTVLEALHLPLEALRGEMMHPRAVRALDALGLSAVLRDRGSVDVAGFATFDGASRPPVILPYSRGKGLGLEHKEILTAFRQKLGARVRLETGAKAEALLLDGGRVGGVRCVDGREFRARLVVAADGRDSRMRKLFAVPTEVALKSYMFGVTVAGDTLPQPGYGNVFVGAPGPILAYPFGGGQVRMCIDVPLEAPRGKERLIDYVATRYAAFVPPSIRGPMIESLRCDAFRLCAVHQITTDACVVPGGAIVGDAGGCSHPVTAGGMTLACHDVLLLTDCLVRDGLTDVALAAYQRQRYGFVRARELFTASLYDVSAVTARARRRSAKRSSGTGRTGHRGRRRSISLSGEESRSRAFLVEYSRVLGHAATGLGAYAWQTMDARGAMRRTKSLAGTAYECLDLAIEKAVSALRLSLPQNRARSVTRAHVNRGGERQWPRAAGASESAGARIASDVLTASPRRRRRGGRRPHTAPVAMRRMRPGPNDTRRTLRVIESQVDPSHTPCKPRPSFTANSQVHPRRTTSAPGSRSRRARRAYPLRRGATGQARCRAP